MQLTLEQVSKQVGAFTHIHPTSLAPKPGAITVLLGATLAGKTTLMRIMAGLDRPSAGRVLVDERDVTGVPVRERAVAMVYQQFINYPSMSVFDNIASPLKLQRFANVDQRVRALAAKLHIDHLLDRYPSQLSGGQQQRVALARALAKGAPLILLDEPLVNLDYKLREELREELTQLFASGEATVVYATTEPAEALMLGGYTAVLDCGRLLQYGPTAEVFHRPASIDVARAFSDPPMNLVQGTPLGDSIVLPGITIALPGKRTVAGAAATIGVRAHDVRVHAQPGDISLPARVELAEISGSDTYVHAATAIGEMVAQLTGVHRFSLGEAVTLNVNPDDIYVFDASGALTIAPARLGRAAPASGGA